MQTVIVTGSSGLVGSETAKRFAQKGLRIVGIDNDMRAQFFGAEASTKSTRDELLKNLREYEHHDLDIRNAKSISALFAKHRGTIRAVVHTAAQPSHDWAAREPQTDFTVNANGTLNLLEAARENCPEAPFVFTSTNKVYGDLGLGLPVVSGKRYAIPGHKGTAESQPLDFHSPYGCSKGAADQYVRDFGRIYGLPTVVFRMSCVAGPRQFGTEDQGWVAHFVYSALQGQPVVIYGDGRQVRDVLCVEDLIRAFDAVHQNIETTRTEVYNVGGGLQNSVSLLELVDEIELLTGRRLECVADERRLGDQLVYITDNSKLQHDTGWTPEIGLRKTVRLLREFWEQNHGALKPHRSMVAPDLSPFALAAEFSGRVG